ALRSRNERIRHCGWCLGYGNAGGFERLDFSRSCALATGDNGTSMSHPAAGWRGDTGDKSRDRSAAIILDPCGSFFFSRAADFAHQNHRFGPGIIIKHPDGIEMRHAVDGVPTNSDAGRLSMPTTR